jgi:hypothetical protein
MAETKRMTAEQVVSYLLEEDGVDFLRESFLNVMFGGRPDENHGEDGPLRALEISPPLAPDRQRGADRRKPAS